MIRDSDLTQTEYARYFRWTKDKVRYHIKKLLKANMITSIKHTQFFKCTLTGVSFLGEYESNDKKVKKAIENARWKTTIRNDKLLQKFLFEYGFTHHPMNNWIQWNGNIEGFSITINDSILKKTLLITHPTMYGGNFIDQLKNAEERVSVTLSNLNKKWNFDLSLAEPVSGFQFTTNDPIADEIMRKSGGSQIKIGKRLSFDQSYHSEPRTEFSTVDEATLWSAVPQILPEMFKMMKNQEGDWKILKPSMISMTENMGVMTRTMQKMLDTMVAIKDLFEKASKEQPPEKPKPMDDYLKRMFG